MTESKNAVHMVRLGLRTDKMMALGRKKKLPPHMIDEGYMVHLLLKELFGKLAPQPFSYRQTRGRYIEVIGYSAATKDQLLDHAQSFASPTAFESCDWDQVASKPMPSSFPKNKKLGFEVRICPVIRKSKAGEHHKKGAEVDAFVSACWDVGDPSVPVDREKVYRDWLQAQFDRLGSIKLASARMTSFKRSRLLRRTHGEQRKSRGVERPDALFTGVIEVGDDAGMQKLLSRGLGRHRAFGFGMLLLKPA